MLRNSLGALLLVFAAFLAHTPGIAAGGRATSSMSNENDFDRPGGTYSRLSLPLGASGDTFDARYQCSFTCYNASQCRAFTIHKENGAAICELKSKAANPVFRKGYASGRRGPPIQTGGTTDDGPPTEEGPLNGVASCTHLGLKCPGSYKLAIVRGSCTCTVRGIDTPDAGANGDRQPLGGE